MRKFKYFYNLSQFTYSFLNSVYMSNPTKNKKLWKIHTRKIRRYKEKTSISALLILSHYFSSLFFCSIYDCKSSFLHIYDKNFQIYHLHSLQAKRKMNNHKSLQLLKVEEKIINEETILKRINTKKETFSTRRSKANNLHRNR